MQKKYDLNFLIKYPFLNETKEYVMSLNIKLAEIHAHPIYSAALDLARQRIGDAVESRKTDYGDELPELVILSFPLARILANLTGSRTILNKFAEAEAKQMSKLISEEPDENVNKILDELKLNLNENKIYFTKYLKLASNLAKYREEFKLVNRVIENGFVKIDKEDKTALIKEAIKLKISEPIDAKNIPENFKNIARTLNTELSTEELKVEHVDKDALPPCITNMLLSMASGVVSHNSMFVLATFFINLNLDIASIVQVFSIFPKFNEEKTKYQIEFLAGVKSTTKYSCPACVTIKSYGLCPVDCGVKHPLHYYKDHMKDAGKVEEEKKTEKGEEKKGEEKKTEKGEEKKAWEKKTEKGRKEGEEKEEKEGK